MSKLPLRAMVLYKHGVGFFMREGAVEGESVALSFRQDEINDVLKSLTLFDRSGGHILGVHYQTPMDTMSRLATSSIQLSDHASLRDLLRDLRGRVVSLMVAYPNTNEVYEQHGRLIGVDEPPQQQLMAQDSAAVVTLLAENSQDVLVFGLKDVRGVRILDSQSAHDLSYFLDTSVGDNLRQDVTVRLSAGEHQLVLNYVAPSPTWRVSYRIVAESDEHGETGQALLQGWGLFDNRLEEDLEDVQVTLVAGQPISFIYELYESRIPERPHVRDESRVAPGPIEYAAEVMADEAMAGAAYFAKSAPASAPKMMMARAAAPMIERDQMAQSVQMNTETKDAGEFFQYIVTAPVSVKRGESALVPIIGATLQYQRELLYNRVKLANHPVAALRFKNTTALTLERGPVTVVEDADYKGEAVLPFSKEDGEVYLPYAVELGVKVTERPEHRIEMAGLKIDGAYLRHDEYHVYEVSYLIENTTAKALTVSIEAPIIPERSLFDTPKVDAETATERRWRVQVGARSKTELVVKERQLTWRREELRKLYYEELRRFLENRWLDQATYDALAEMLDNLGKIQQAKVERQRLNEEREKVYKQQEQLRANLQTLQSSGQEALLRKRMLEQLEASQNRLEEIEQDLNDLAQLEVAAEARVKQIIAALG